MLHAYCRLNIIPKLAVSWQFFETYGVINCGNGWRKDVVKTVLGVCVACSLTTMAKIAFCLNCQTTKPISLLSVKQNKKPKKSNIGKCRSNAGSVRSFHGCQKSVFCCTPWFVNCCYMYLLPDMIMCWYICSQIVCCCFYICVWLDFFFWIWLERGFTYETIFEMCINDWVWSSWGNPTRSTGR